MTPVEIALVKALAVALDVSPGDKITVKASNPAVDVNLDGEVSVPA